MRLIASFPRLSRLRGAHFHRVAGLALLAGLAGCGLPGTGVTRAESVQLGSQSLAVRFTDGVSCRADLPPGGGQGMFVDCPHEARFAVQVDHQNWLEPALGDMVQPYARIRITTEDGRVQDFRTPASAVPGWRR